MGLWFLRPNHPAQEGYPRGQNSSPSTGNLSFKSNDTIGPHLGLQLGPVPPGGSSTAGRGLAPRPPTNRNTLSNHLPNGQERATWMIFVTSRFLPFNDLRRFVSESRLLPIGGWGATTFHLCSPLSTFFGKSRGLAGSARSRLRSMESWCWRRASLGSGLPTFTKEFLRRPCESFHVVTYSFMTLWGP